MIMKHLLQATFFATTMIAFAQASQAISLTFTANLSGANEATPNASTGTGTATVTIDNVLHTMRVQAIFSGLTGNVTAAHIHAATAVAGTGTAGVATTTPTFPSFPSGVKSGSYDQTFDMTLATSYNAAFVTANGGTTSTAETALFNAIQADKAYFNIHSSTFGGGEIRGFFTPTPVPFDFAPTPALVILGGGFAVNHYIKKSRKLTKK
jgi:hypothetical protein